MHYYLLIISFLSLVDISAQESCAFDWYNEMIISDSQLSGSRGSLENLYATSSDDNNLKSSEGDISLPVVFHIIHNNGTENISDSDIFRSFDFMNEAFSNIGSYYSDTGYNTKISFCMAQRDTLGEFFNGIVRHESSFTDMSNGVSHDMISSLAYYNPLEYINIRIMKEVCGQNCEEVAGYAVNAFPAYSYKNCIVIEYEALSSGSWDASSLVHEMGHFLGLLHPFYDGCKNDNCLVDGDGVCDTPPDSRSTITHCQVLVNSCSTDEDDLTNNNPF